MIVRGRSPDGVHTARQARIVACAVTLLLAAIGGCVRIQRVAPARAACPAPRLSARGWVAVEDSGVTFRLPPAYVERPSRAAFREWAENGDFQQYIIVGYIASSNPAPTLGRAPGPGMLEMTQCVDSVAGREVLVQAWRSRGGTFRNGRRLDRYDVFAVVPIRPDLRLYVTSGGYERRTQDIALAVVRTIATAQPAAAVADPVLPHQTWTLDSRVLGENRRINVYTPPGYDETPGARYPVLYMPDGGLEEDFPHVTVDIDAAIRAGEMRPVIVVGIENTERRRDMTGPTSVEADRKIAPHVGGSARFRAFIRDELMPVVGRRVRGNGQTAIVGESLAGLFVVETFFEEPRLFDTWIALSPSLWWNAQAQVRGAREWLRAQPRLTGTLYLATAGDDDVGDAGKALAAALRAAAPRGLRWYYEPRPDLRHATIYRGASPGVFRKLFPPARKTAP